MAASQPLTERYTYEDYRAGRYCMYTTYAASQTARSKRLAGLIVDLHTVFPE